MRKLFALLLAMAMLLSLCACGNEAKTTDPTGESQSTTSGETTTENTTNGTTEGATEDATTGTTEAPTEAPTQAPTQAPETAPAACSHNWKAATCTTNKTCTKCGATEGGSATGHSWVAATCTAPKTCANCKSTEGTVGDHAFVDGACSVCGTEDRINPTGKIPDDSEYIGNFTYDEENSSALASAIYFYTDRGHCLLLNWLLSEDPAGEVILNGKKYESGGMGGGAVPFWYEITDTEVIITNEVSEDNNGVPCLKLIMLSNGNLKITYSMVDAWPALPVGTILYAGREAAAQSTNK